MKKFIIVITLIIILVLFFYPKSYVRGGLQGGPIGPGETAYKEEFSCFGIKHSYYPSGCADCGNVYNCYGLNYNKKCYTEVYSYSGGGKLSKDSTQCK